MMDLKKENMMETDGTLLSTLWRPNWGGKLKQSDYMYV